MSNPWDRVAAENAVNEERKSASWATLMKANEMIYAGGNSQESQNKSREFILNENNREKGMKIFNAGPVMSQYDRNGWIDIPDDLRRLGFSMKNDPTSKTTVGYFDYTGKKVGDAGIPAGGVHDTSKGSSNNFFTSLGKDFEDAARMSIGRVSDIPGGGENKTLGQDFIDLATMKPFVSGASDAIKVGQTLTTGGQVGSPDEVTPPALSVPGAVAGEKKSTPAQKNSTTGTREFDQKRKNTASQNPYSGRATILTGALGVPLGGEQNPKRKTLLGM